MKVKIKPGTKVRFRREGQKYATSSLSTRGGTYDLDKMKVPKKDQDKLAKLDGVEAAGGQSGGGQSGGAKSDGSDK